jgi:hypothetical protein
MTFYKFPLKKIYFITIKNKRNIVYKYLESFLNHRLTPGTTGKLSFPESLTDCTAKK